MILKWGKRVTEQNPHSGQAPPQPVMVQPDRPNTGTLMLYAYRSFEEELFTRLHAAGHRDLRPKHGAVIANLEEQGTRVTTLARRAGIGNPAMVELVDELERAGYVSRRPDPSDRRAKLVIPTLKGVHAAQLAFAVIQGIEARYKRLLGSEQYAQLQDALDKICGTAEPLDCRKTNT